MFTGQAGGTWGEHHGEPVSVSRGVYQFERAATGKLGQERTVAEVAEVDENQPLGVKGESLSSPTSPDEKTPVDKDSPGRGRFDLREWIENRQEAELEHGITGKNLGVAWRNLGVLAPKGSTSIFIRTLPQAIAGTFGPDLYRFVTQLGQSFFRRKDVDRSGMKEIIQGHNGILLPG